MVYPEVIELPEGARELHVIIHDAESGRLGSLAIPLGEH